jgi:hypothetical protein
MAYNYSVPPPPRNEPVTGEAEEENDEPAFLDEILTTSEN